MVTISACLIVKNEEDVLARCLDSLAGIYDELIIVDTGSTDSTVDIASRYTDKIYHFDWIDDFAAARNYLFSKATMEYIYVADADEVLLEAEHKKFMQLKQVLLPEIEIVQMKYANQLSFNTTYNFDLEERPKLYRRLRTFTWIDPIHESVRLDPVVYNSDIIVSHMPTSNHASRDFGVFQRVICNGQELSPKLRRMYAKELYISGEDADFLEAEPYFNHLLASEQTMEELRLIYCILMKCARIRDDLMQLFTYSTKVLAAQITSSEICYELGEFYIQQKNYEDAFLWFYNAVYESESELNIHYQGDYSLNRIADCYHELGMAQEESDYRQRANEWTAQRG